MKQSEPCMKTKLNTNTNTVENPKRSPVQPTDINKDINENKMKDITIKKQNPIKRIITSNKFEEIEEMEIKNKTPTNKSQSKKSQKSKHQLCMYHNKSNKYLLPAIGTYSAIDLSICNPSLFLDYNWKVHDDTCGSDHFPILFENTTDEPSKRTPLWLRFL